ncbi:MAG TPA: hypothetical protein VGH49_18480, partial [Xanthobacteraceae bacterium]
MVSTLNVALGALSALVFWTCIGVSITRRIVPGTLALPLAPVVGWAAHSALALPIFWLIGFSQASVLAVAVLALAASLASLRGKLPIDRSDDGLRVPGWALAAAAVLALPAAIALLPKSLAGGVILAGPLFDHSKIAIIDEMARLGVPPGNPFVGLAGEPGIPARLVYYYLWHFGAAELALALGVRGWEADIALTWFTAFASLAVMMGLAARFGARRSAAFWVVPFGLAASLRPVLSWLWSPEKLEAVLLPGTGFAGWLFQAAWVPQHVMSASCCVVATMLMSRLAQRRSALVLVGLALVVAAGLGCSTWVGGVTFGLAALMVGAALLVVTPAGERVALLGYLALAAILAAGLAAPFWRDQFAAAAMRGGGAPVVIEPYAVLGDFFPETLRRILDLPAYWIVLLVVEFPAIYVTGAVALAAALARKRLDRERKREALALALLGAGALVVSWLMASTLGGNNDLGWRA